MNVTLEHKDEQVCFKPHLKDGLNTLDNVYNGFNGIYIITDDELTLNIKKDTPVKPPKKFKKTKEVKQLTARKRTQPKICLKFVKRNRQILDVAFKTYYKQKEISEMFCLSQSVISKIINRGF